MPQKKLPASIRRQLETLLRRAETGPNFTSPAQRGITEPEAVHAETERNHRLWRDTWLVPQLQEILRWDRGEATLNDVKNA